MKLKKPLNPEAISQMPNTALPKENVNHPSHYNRENSIECLEEMIEIFGIPAVMNFCLCNVWKYRYRAGDKNGQEDVKKSDWYMNKYLELKYQYQDNLVRGIKNTPLGCNPYQE